VPTFVSYVGSEELTMRSGMALPLILTADENRLTASTPASGPAYALEDTAASP
jgi:hypothetical protein